MSEEVPYKAVIITQKIFNSKLVAMMTGVAAITVLAALGVVSGGVAVPVIIGLVGGYGAYRVAVKPHG